MLNRDQIDEFDRNGFLNGGVVLTDGEVGELSEALDAILEKGPDGFAAGEPQPVSFRSLAGDEHPVWQIVNIWEASPAFEKLIYHLAVVEGISELAGHRDLMVWHDQIQYKPAEYGGSTHWHQDAPLWPIIKPMTPVSAWIPFDDATEENGCMWMVPGSHRWGNQKGMLTVGEDFKCVHREPEKLPAGAEVLSEPVEVKKGAVGFHHCMTWHGSPHNRTDRPRRAIAVHYMPAHIRYDPIGTHVMEPYVPEGTQPGDILQGESFPVVYEKN